MKPYFGYATFAEYYVTQNKKGFGYEGITLAQAWNGILEKINSGLPTDVARHIANMLTKEPTLKFNVPTWYFVMPEGRASLTPELLAIVDGCGAGVKPE